MFKILGIIGAFLVTYSNIPQIILFIRQKHARGISKSSNWIALAGVLMRMSYIIDLTGFDLIVLVPYALGLSSLVITLYYCYKD